MMSLYTGEPLLYCVGCCQCVCSGPCLAAHRHIYTCHNAWCHFHAPTAPPAPPAANDQGPPQPPATTTNDAGAITASIIQNTGGAPIQATLATNPRDPNVIRREAIAREWRRVGAGPTAPTAAAQDTTTGTNAGAGQPARFSIEEYEAQAGLLERFQPRRGRQPQPGPGEGSRDGPNGRRRVQIIWEY